MSGLVVGGVLLLLVTQDHRAPFGPHHDLVLGDLEVRHRDDLAVLPRGEQRRLVTQIGQVSPRKAGRAARQHHQIHVIGQGHLGGMHLQDPLAPAHVGTRYDHPPVKAARTQQGGIENIGPIGGRHQDDALVRVEAVHLD